MEELSSELLRAIQWLKDSSVAVEQQYQAAFLIRMAVLDSERRKLVQELDVIAPLVPMLYYGAEHPMTIVVVEALACLVADNPKGRV
jgi:hypothetical protein